MPARTLSGARDGVVKFGRNADLDSATPEDIWSVGGLWVAPTAARIHAIASTDNVDDKVGGAGALTLTIHGLDANWQEAHETVILTGTTPVNTIGTYRRIHRMYVATAGANGVNTGIISATAAVDGTVTAAVPALESQTQMAIFTVPVGFRALLERYYCTFEPGTPAVTLGTLKLITRPNADTANAAWRTSHINGVSDAAPLNFPFNGVMEAFEAKTDIRLNCSTSKDNTIVNGGFSLILLPTT